MEVLFPKLGEIAANRYTKILPAVLRVCLMMNFYTLLKKALATLLKGLKIDSDDDAVLQDSDAVVGAPVDIMVHQRKLAAKQQEKIERLFENDDVVPMSFLVWVSIMMILQPLHYSIFKRGVFFNRKASGPEGERHGMFHYCNPKRSPATRALEDLASLMFSPSTSQHARLLAWRLGPVECWPLAVVTGLHICLVSVVAKLWRKLVHALTFYPWKLAVAFGPLTDDVTRKEYLAEFLKIPKGSKVLDPGLFRKLRDVVEIVDDLLQPDFLILCKTCFSDAWSHQQL